MTSDCLPHQVALLESIEGAGRKRKRSTEAKTDIEPSDHHGAQRHEDALSSVEVTAGGAVMGAVAVEQRVGANGSGAVMGADAEAGPTEAAAVAKSPVTAPPETKRAKLDADEADEADEAGMAGVAAEALPAALDQAAMEEAAMEDVPPPVPGVPETDTAPAAAAKETEVDGMAVEPAAPDTAPVASAVEPPAPEPMVPETAPVPMVEDDEEEGVDETDGAAAMAEAKAEAEAKAKAEPAPDAADTSMMEVRSPALETALTITPLMATDRLPPLHAGARDGAHAHGAASGSRWARGRLVGRGAASRRGAARCLVNGSHRVHRARPGAGGHARL